MKATKRVIVCGYPKSGNTWLTRLLAEIIDCPARGFWCEPLNREQSIEGLERDSEFDVFKTHLDYNNLQNSLDIYGFGAEQAVYIYRDPRDVIVSGAHYFRVSPKYPRLHTLLGCPNGGRLHDAMFRPISHRLRIMTHALLEGTHEGAWLRIPWHQHVQAYLADPSIVTVSYETLFDDPLAALTGICAHLGISRTTNQIETAITRQSFQLKKKSLASAGRHGDAAALRSGGPGNWKQVLNERHLTAITNRIGPFVASLGYDAE